MAADATPTAQDITDASAAALVTSGNLTLAQQVSDDDISPRIQHFGEIEATLISTPDNAFRFHSGVPV